MLEFSLAIISGYLIGSISFGYILVRLFHNEDIRKVGEKTAGTTNVIKNYGKPIGLITAILDGLKGLLTVLLWIKLSNTEWIAVVAGASAVLGHVFPVYFNFKGGKGQATAIGGLFYFINIELLIILIIWAVISFLTKRIYFSGTLAVTTIPLLTIFFGRSILMIFLTVLMATLRWIAQIKAFKSIKYAKVS